MNYLQLLLIILILHKFCINKKKEYMEQPINNTNNMNNKVNYKPVNVRVIILLAIVCLLLGSVLLLYINTSSKQLISRSGKAIVSRSANNSI